ncbi:unnamed protein product [Tetraodon nigroviridis]|uniref:(spotted green pufferfish) hypothetical protein n=1 Tax=Tetraodon nigroviridis TaxID=99883 RepID=Q4S978_TETNG|nr:unnamed protein product [Tetraodon nigroviridis]
MERTEVVHMIASAHWALQFASAHVCACVAQRCPGYTAPVHTSQPRERVSELLQGV